MPEESAKNIQEVAKTRAIVKAVMQAMAKPKPVFKTDPAILKAIAVLGNRYAVMEKSIEHIIVGLGVVEEVKAPARQVMNDKNEIQKSLDQIQAQLKAKTENKNEPFSFRKALTENDGLIMREGIWGGK